MNPTDLREMIESADWSDPKFKRLAHLLCDLWIAVDEDKRELNMLPFMIEETDYGDRVAFNRDLWKYWISGPSTDVNVILFELGALQ